MDVRLRVGAPDDPDHEPTDILTDLPDGSLRTLLGRLAARDPAFQRFLEVDTLDPTDLEILVNGRPLGTASPSQFALKDGDTVLVRPHKHR